MRHEEFEVEGPALRLPEWRVVQLLRHAEAPERVELALTRVLGAARARAALAGFTELMTLLRAHGWHAPLLLRPGASSVSDDERGIARFVLLAAEQAREAALVEAMMLVTPQAILPLLSAAERLGLPLLCEECRDRLKCPLTFQ